MEATGRLLAGALRLVSGTPPRPHHDNAKEEEVNEDVAEHSSPSRMPHGHGEMVTNLGASLPDVDDNDWPQPSSPASAQVEPQSIMGAAESKQDANAELHRASRTLRSTNHALPKPPIATGRLKDPKRTTSQPSRALAARGSAYNIDNALDDPPSSLARLQTLRTDNRQQPQFSPVRKERRKAVEAARAAQNSSEQEKGHNAGNAARRSKRHAVPEEDAIPSGSVQVHNDDITVGPEPIAAHAVQSKKGRGRPRRDRSKAGEAVKDAKMIATDATIKEKSPHPKASVAREARPRARKTVPSAPNEAEGNRAADHEKAVIDAAAGSQPGAENDDDVWQFPGTENEHEVAHDERNEMLQANKVQPSELYSRTELNSSSLEEASPGNHSKRAANGRKRKATSSEDGRANTAKKRAKVARQDESLDTVANAQRSDQDRVKLYGQWLALQEIMDNLEFVGCNVINGERQEQNDIDLKDPHVKATVELCREAKERFTKLANDSMLASTDSSIDPAGVLQEIGHRVDGLRGTDENHLPNFKSKRKSKQTVTNIYFHLIPDLVELVYHATQCYLLMDEGHVPPGQIKIGHLRIIYQMIQMILDLESAADKRSNLYVVRPDSGKALVRSVHNDIAVPLRAVSAALRTQIDGHERQVQNARRREADARHRALLLEQEERRNRQQARITKLQKKWRKLHEERRRAEGGFVRRPKAIHLTEPPTTEFEYDGNGELFSRQEVFITRVGPPPARIEQAASEVWSPEELLALHDGLKNYTGLLVFERIFRRYCVVGEVLNRFNVTQIVTTAAIIKDRFLEVQSQDGGVVEQWVERIPVWTKTHADLDIEDKENDDGIVRNVEAED